MIKCVAKSVVEEKNIEEFKSTALELVAESRKDPGCISYQLFQDLMDGTIITFIEEWESADALTLHSNAPHFLTIVPKLEALSTKPMEVNVYSLLI